MASRRWQITSDKFLSSDQVQSLVEYLLAQRDLAIARQNKPQAIRDYYLVRTILESGLRVFEVTNLVNGDIQGQKISVRHGKGDKARTVLLTKTTGNLLKEWQVVKERIGFSTDPMAPFFPSRYNRIYTTRGIQKRVKALFKAMGFPEHLSVHSLRHTYCSLLLSSGKVGIGLVRDNMGHHSIAVTNLYSHAVGNLNDVELYENPSSHNSDNSELRNGADKKKPNSIVKQFLRNVNLK